MGLYFLQYSHIYIFIVFFLSAFLILINGFFFFYSKFSEIVKSINILFIFNLACYFIILIFSLFYFVFFNFSENVVLWANVDFDSTFIIRRLWNPKEDTTHTFYETVMMILWYVILPFIRHAEKYVFKVISSFWLENCYKTLNYLDAASMLFIILLSFLTIICIITHLYQPFQAILIKTVCSEASTVKFNFIDSKRFNNSDKNAVFLANRNTLFLIKIGFLFLTSFIFFSTDNLFVLYITFEASMLPLFFMIGNFGSRVNKIKAAHMLFFFTLIGSIFFLSALILIYNFIGVPDYSRASFYASYAWRGQQNQNLENLIWILLFIPFAIKIPIIPAHIWLPEAHVEASTEGSVLLAGIMLKLGLIGILKFLIPMCPYASVFFAPLVNILAITSIIFFSFNIFTQLDLKKIIAYSSIIHMNYALLGIFSHTVIGAHGAIYLMFTHGIISSGLFIVVGFLYSKFHTRLISYYQGLISPYPALGSAFLILLLGNAAIPGTGGFIGEILIFFSLFKTNLFVAIISLLAPLSGAIVSIIIFVRMFFGVSYFNSEKAYNAWHKINNRYTYVYPILSIEYSVVFCFALLTLQTGLFSAMYLNRLDTSIYFYLSWFL